MRTDKDLQRRGRGGRRAANRNVMVQMAIPALNRLFRVRNLSGINIWIRTDKDLQRRGRGGRRAANRNVLVRMAIPALNRLFRVRNQ